MKESNDQELETFPSGAKSSKAPRYDLIPRWVLYNLAYCFEELGPKSAAAVGTLTVEVAHRFLLGVKKYGHDAWYQGVKDEAFLKARLNHAVEHLLNVIHGTDNGEDSIMENLGAVGWAVAVRLLAERENLKP